MAKDAEVASARTAPNYARGVKREFTVHLKGTEPIMVTRRVTVGSKVGLHARPATAIAEAASHFSEEILIELINPADPDNEPADAASSLMLMALGAEFGDEVSVTSSNATAVERIAELISVELDD